jgi:AcrR family transcriptional regulator
VRNPTYFEGDLRRTLLDSAASEVEAAGAGAISLRSLARAAGVSHAAPAHHFGDKSGLFTALAIEGFDMMVATMRDAAAAAAHEQAQTRLVRTGVGYVGFAVRHRGHFEVMFRPEIVRTDDADLIRASGEAASVLADHVRSAQADGWATHVDSTTIITTAWALVHGLATLATQGALGPIDAIALEHLTERTATLLADGLAIAHSRLPSLGDAAGGQAE